MRKKDVQEETKSAKELAADAEDVLMASQMAEVVMGKHADAGDREKSKKFLKYQFTESEKKTLSEEMARNVKEKDSVTNELKSIQGQFNARKKQAEAVISECAEKISSGYEYRQIDCETVRDFATGYVIAQRLDTYEIVENRKMTMADRQMTI